MASDVHIFAGNPVMAALVKSVAGSDFIVESITQPGTSLHECRLTPKMALRLQCAKIVFYASKRMEPAIKCIMGRTSNIRVIEIIEDATFRRGLINLKYYAGSNFEPDGHIWIMPEVAAMAIDVIYRNLITVWPEHKMMFYSNMVKACQVIEGLQKWTAETLGDRCRSTSFFAVHDSFFYLYKALKLNFRFGITADIENGILPRSAIALKNVNSQKLCFFAEHSHGRFAQRLLGHLREKVIPILLDIDGMDVDFQSGIDGYNAFIKKNIKLMQNCICAN